jgi:hypothetical protein
MPAPPLSVSFPTLPCWLLAVLRLHTAGQEVPQPPAAAATRPAPSWWSRFLRILLRTLSAWGV